jgi:predicted Holliday junction resolvase-like endonuclease
MSATLIIIIVIAVLFILLAVAVKIISNQVKETKKLKADLDAQQQNLITLYKHAQEIAEIEKNKNRTDQVIEEAKSDEEVIDIINTIININNGRVRK